MNPQEFRPADIVRIQVSFVAFRVQSRKNQGRRFIVKPVLRSITHLDSSLRIVSRSTYKRK